ncbi:tetratricopeptide repeat protein [Candidatus Electronema sp. TJ]|uniref:tetratricopeptide repeat protein n=1 Tax=Candidatus Electronema sp. TJ TaxID=3401573 RepID=UPI003AA83C6A
MDWLERIKEAWRWVPKNPDVIWSGWGLMAVSAGITVLFFVCSKLYACLRKPKAVSVQPDVSALPTGSVLTFEQYKKDLLELHEKYVLEKQKREDIERKLANPDESYQEKLRLLEESQEKLQQLAGSLPKEQLAEAEERLAQGDTELAEQLFDRVAAETGQTAAAALLQSGRLAKDRLDYSKALRNYAAAVALAPDNPDYLLPAGQMAYQMGEYQQAEEWLAHLLAIREQEGEENAELGLALNDLAGVYADQGRYEEAEPLHKRSLEIREKKLGKDHPDVAESLNNLALLYDSRGRCEEAEPLYKRSLEIWEKALGKEHPHVAAALNNLAALYDSRGRCEEAEPLYKRSLEIWEKALGKEHPHVAVSLNNLAALYYSQSRYEEAEPLYKRDLEISEKSLGKDHPDVAASLNNLALLYKSQGRYEESEPLYQRALTILKAKFPGGHPDIDTFQANYNKLKEKMQAR